MWEPKDHGIKKWFDIIEEKMSFKIISAKDVPGTDLVQNWRRNHMQVVETDNGIFIDNPPGIQNGDYQRGAPGYDWQKEIGNVVSGVWVTKTNGYCWLNKTNE